MVRSNILETQPNGKKNNRSRITSIERREKHGKNRSITKREMKQLIADIKEWKLFSEAPISLV